MRFSRLSLERYGRFEDCELNFRSGSPDLHIIYGANEAGKTTSLAAVSDLLFGFPTRSPYNFLFDYSLLRVGAVIQDGDLTLSCRRKKGSSATLLNESDASIDEAPLGAMLKGQSRETFALLFSLDQNALRSGGRAMVEAKNDLGRALFAAGSGLTGIADELKNLEAEADAIWAPTASQRRSFTQAQTQLAEANRLIRDQALKPKAWADARQATKQALEALENARKLRDEVQTELRATDRVRRLAPLVRRHQEQLELLRSYENTVDLGRPREDAAEKIIQEADEAERQQAAAEHLRGDVAERRSQVTADPAILARSDEIEQLVADGRAGDKAARDLVSLESELASAEVLTRRLKAEAGVNADAAPPRSVAAQLRDLARVHGEIAASSRAIAESRTALEDRRRRAQSKIDESPGPGSLDAVAAAVDTARALGSEADVRSDAEHRKAETSLSTVKSMLARLVPWQGTIEELVVLPTISTGEIEEARSAVAERAADIGREEEKARRSDDQAAGLSLEIDQLATGAAVSPDEVASAKHDRDERWKPIRANVLAGTKLPSPDQAVGEFEASVSSVDEKLDRRFALADASSRLSILEQAKATEQLQSRQANERAEAGRKKHAAALAEWHERLLGAGLPALDPLQFASWQNQRLEAESEQENFLDLRAQADDLINRRNASRGALAQALGSADPGGQLQPVLSTAERKRLELEEAAQRRRLALEQLEQDTEDARALDRRQQRVEEDAAENSRLWSAALSEAGLAFDVVTCSAVLDLLDELREAQSSEASLRRRVDGIRRDARNHAVRVRDIADEAGIEPGETSVRLSKLCERLTSARATATLIGSLEDEERRRFDEAQEAAAKLEAADKALEPLLEETSATDRVGLAAAIERSRAKRQLAEDLESTQREIIEEGDGLALGDLVVAVAASNLEQIPLQVSALNVRLEELNDEVDRAATTHGDARSAFAALDTGETAAVAAAADAEQARSELEVLAEHYILKRAQAVTLKWAIEKYRQRHQDPLLLRAGELFSILTAGRYKTLRVDADAATPRLLGLRDDERTMVEVGAMSEGTTDQLFLALRLAALERSVAAGIKLPFLADDLFVNFDDQRAEAGFKVLAEVARSTQVLFFTHHSHLVEIAKMVVGAEVHSECALT